MVLLCGVTGLDEVVVVDGHEAGDEVVRRVADGLRPAVTGAAALGRLSGDVLAVVEVLADGDPHEHLQRRFADLGTRLANVGGLPARVRVAMGAVVAGDDACPEDLLRDGTAALHRAAGGGGPEVFDDALRHRLRTRAATEEALRHAVARDEIEVHYQPLVDARTREVTAYEALARWRRGSEPGAAARLDPAGRGGRADRRHRPAGAEHRLPRPGGPGGAGRGERLGAPGGRRALPGRRAGGRGRLLAGDADPRGHRERADVGRRPRGAQPDAAAGGRHPGRARRLRHRLLAGRALDAAGRRPEDRPGVRHRPGRARRARGARRDRRAGPGGRHVDGRRGRRDPRACARCRPPASTGCRAG
nr:EAL domain-containing protein [Angustibacter aerolatus]